METITWHPNGQCFLMAGRQAQGTWNTALFSATDGELLHSQDLSHRITESHFSPDGKSLHLAFTQGQPKPDKDGHWPKWGKVMTLNVEL